MANEKRLIDANALSEKIGKMKDEITHNCGGYRYCNEDEKNEWDKLDSFDSLVCDAPTVDAVEVVRCKDCKHYMTIHCTCDGCCISDDWYCADGERREERGITMDVREKLVELLCQVQYLGGLEEKIADHLIATA